MLRFSIPTLNIDFNWQLLDNWRYFYPRVGVKDVGRYRFFFFYFSTFFFIKSFHWRQYSESGSGVWSLITVKMKSTSIMETGRQKEEIKWIPTQTIRKKVGHWSVSHSVQNAELQPPLLCRCLCFCARGTTYTNTRRPGDLIMSSKKQWYLWWWWLWLSKQATRCN